MWILIEQGSNRLVSFGDGLVQAGAGERVVYRADLDVAGYRAQIEALPGFMPCGATTVDAAGTPVSFAPDFARYGAIQAGLKSAQAVESPNIPYSYAYKKALASCEKFFGGT
jgi:hypothetical protein